MTMNDEQLTEDEKAAAEILTAVSTSTYPPDIAEALVLSARD